MRRTGTRTFIVVQYGTDQTGDWDWCDTADGLWHESTPETLEYARAYRARFDATVLDAPASRIITRTVTETVIE